MRTDPVQIQAVTFDAGGTLIEPHPSVGHVYAEVAAHHGWGNVAPEALNRQFAAAWRGKQSFDYSRAAWQRLVGETFAGLVEKEPSQALFEDLYRRFESPQAWRVFDDVHPTLAHLRRCGFKLGLISNWDERLPPLLTRLNLSQYFDAMVISVAAGSAKPSVEIFQHAALALGLPPRAVLHVGDSSHEDETGAQSAGMSALLIDRKAARRTVRTITTLEELGMILEKVVPTRVVE